MVDVPGEAHHHPGETDGHTGHQGGPLGTKVALVGGRSQGGDGGLPGAVLRLERSWPSSHSPGWLDTRGGIIETLNELKAGGM